MSALKGDSRFFEPEFVDNQDPKITAMKGRHAGYVLKATARSERIDAAMGAAVMAVTPFITIGVYWGAKPVPPGEVEIIGVPELLLFMFAMFVIAAVVHIAVWLAWPWLILGVYAPICEGLISLFERGKDAEQYVTQAAVAKHQASQLKSAVNHRTRDRHKSELAVKEKKLLDIRQQSRADLRSENAKTRITQLESAMREETFREHQADVRADLKDAEALFASIDAVEDPAARTAIAKRLIGEIYTDSTFLT